MIALCSSHHPQADGGAWTKEQLHAFKIEGAERAESREIREKFNWMRNDLLAVVGGSFFYETETILQMHGSRVVWFARNQERNLLLNVRLDRVPSPSKLDVRIEDNAWMVRGDPSEVQCPPSGKRLLVRYPNGHEFGVQFFEIMNSAGIKKKYENAKLVDWSIIQFPTTIVEINFRISSAGLVFGPQSMNLRGANWVGGFFDHVNIAISLN
jgi:hypothetical protein